MLRDKKLTGNSISAHVAVMGHSSVPPVRGGDGPWGLQEAVRSWAVWLEQVVVTVVLLRLPWLGSALEHGCAGQNSMEQATRGRV